VPRVILAGDAAGADGIFGEGISIALGYGRLAATPSAMPSPGMTMAFTTTTAACCAAPWRGPHARTIITRILYRLHWAWFQRFFWRVFKPVVAVVSFVLVLNWARRMR